MSCWGYLFKRRTIQTNELAERSLHENRVSVTFDFNIGQAYELEQFFVGAASSVNRFHWSEGIVNRCDVGIRHEQRIIYRVGPPCFDLIIFNKREMAASRILVSAWWYTQLKSAFH